MENNKRFNNILGEEYEAFAKAVSHYGEFQEKVAEEVSNFISKDNLILLEIGCGSGITTNSVLEKINNKVHIKAVDNEQKMLDQAEKVLSGNLDEVELINSDILDYLKDVPDSYFDGIFSGFVIHNIAPDIRKEIFKEISRVSKDNGFFVNGDKIAVNDEDQHYTNYKDFMKLLEKIGTEQQMPKLADEWIKHYEEDEFIKFTEREQVTLLEDNGFSEIKFVFRKLLDSVVVSIKR